MPNNYILTADGELYHYGVKGMKWGIRRYQNKDGSLTPAGKKHVYKTLKKRINAKDRRQALGQAVGEDKLITDAARKAVPAIKKYREVSARRSEMEREMEAAYHKEMDRRWHEDDCEQKVNKTIADKYGKKFKALCEEDSRAYAEYKKALGDVADEYLGKYGDRPVNSMTTAKEALSIQIDWGLNLGRLKNDEDLSY